MDKFAATDADTCLVVEPGSKRGEDGRISTESKRRIALLGRKYKTKTAVTRFSMDLCQSVRLFGVALLALMMFVSLSAGETTTPHLYQELITKISAKSSSNLTTSALNVKPPRATYLVSPEGILWRIQRFRVRKTKNSVSNHANKTLPPDRTTHHNQSKEVGLLVSYETNPYQTMQIARGRLITNWYDLNITLFTHLLHPVTVSEAFICLNKRGTFTVYIDILRNTLPNLTHYRLRTKVNQCHHMITHRVCTNGALLPERFESYSTKKTC